MKIEQMEFERHRTNLIEWLYLGKPETGFETDAAVLLLGEKETLQPFETLLKSRVKTISYKLDDGSYDYVIVPRLTKKILRPFEGSILKMIQTLTATWLNSGGRIVIGMENANEIERLAGARRDETCRYVTYTELKKLREALFQEYVLCKEQLYFPLPEADMPLSIYSEQYWPKKEDEDGRIGALCAEGVFAQLAPSYLLVFQPDGTAGVVKKDYRGYTPVFVKYNSSRKPEYAQKTMISLDREGKRHVVKQALTREANAHIESLVEKAELVKRGNQAIKVLEPEAIRKAAGAGERCSAIVYPFIPGQPLSKLLAEMIQDGKAPVEALRQSMDMIIGQREGTLSVANLDCLFSNVLVYQDQPTLIDCEWVVQEPTEVRFLQYRMLKYWYEAYRDMMEYEDIYAFFREFGMEEMQISRYDMKETAFQLMVHGDGEKTNIAAYYDSKMTLPKAERLKTELSEARSWIERLKEEIKDQDVSLKKERELNRLTNVHVSNLEAIIGIHTRDIGNLQGELAYYQAHQSLGSKLSRHIDEKLSEQFPKGSRKRKILGYAARSLRHPIQYGRMYASEEGRNLIQGDFNIGSGYLESGRLHFPYAENPMVSIVIPCYNQIHYTYNCLKSIFKNTDFEATPYEIIIADDVSTDATKELHLYADNLVLARNEVNQGFLKNCNQAAARARGRYIFFLNNDTTVEPDWLSPLVELIERDESIGMVGSKLIYPDGRLQEAGGIIWSDASGWNYGRLQDPTEPQFNYVKDVDYISGAAIMISKQLWDEIGGFDERFAPAYCEDSDLAFEVRRHGKRVVYQPKSVIVHYEGVSNGTDVEGSGLKRYQKVNQEKFREKWAEELKKQSVNTGSPNPFKARERSQNKPCVLVIDHYVPTWDKDAGSKTTYQYIKMLIGKGYQVKFLGDNFLHEEPYSSTLEQMGVEILYGPKLQSGIWDWIKENKEMIDIAYLNRPHITVKYIDFLKENTEIKCIYYGHDLHFLREMREYRLTGDEQKKKDSEYWKNIELSVMRKADVSYYPSQVEVNAIHELDSSIPVKAITAYVFDEPVQPDENFALREGLLFVGGFAHPPNKDAVLWFADHIFPKIRAKLPEVRFHIVGSKADEEVLALGKRKGIRVLGFVSDEELARQYQRNRLVVVPLRYGAGVKGKVVEALYNGAPIVTTSCGAEGIPEVEQVLRIEDEVAAFADCVTKLYKDEASLRQMSQAACAYIEAHFSVEGAWRIIEPDFRVTRDEISE